MTWPRRVLHVVPDVAPSRGGPARSVRALVEAQRAAGHDARLLAAHAEGPATEPLELAGWLPGEVPSPRGARRLARAIRGADLVHIHSVWNGTSTLAAWLCRRLGVPYVVAPRGMLSERGLASRRWRKAVYRATVDRRLLRGAAGLHFLSADERDGAHGAPRSVPAVVAPNGVGPCPVVPDPAWYGAWRPAGTRGRPLALFLGRLDPIKGIELQLEALAALPRAGRPALALVGPDFGVRLALEREALRLGVAGDVWFLPPLFGPERFHALAFADAVVITSHYDCCPNVALETVAAGGALVATQGSGVSFLADLGAALVLPRDVASLAPVMAGIRQSPELTAVRAETARAREALAWPRIVEQLAAFYAELAP